VYNLCFRHCFSTANLMEFVLGLKLVSVNTQLATGLGLDSFAIKRGARDVCSESIGF